MKKTILIFSFAFVTLFSFGQIAQEKARFKNMMIQGAKELNQQLPIFVDENTVLTSVLFYDWIWTYRYCINIDKDDYSQSDMNKFIEEIRQYVIANHKENIDTGMYNITRSELKKLMKATGLKYKYIYLDRNNKLVGTFNLTYLNF
jgi:hypothetical protein